MEDGTAVLVNRDGGELPTATESPEVPPLPRRSHRDRRLQVSRPRRAPASTPDGLPEGQIMLIDAHCRRPPYEVYGYVELVEETPAPQPPNRSK